MTRVLVLAAALMFAARPAAAHPIHTTLTVLRHDAAGRVVTLSIRAFADDFSAAVARAAGKPVPRDSSVVAEDVTRYVRSAFTIEGVTLEACGIERTGDAYLLCFRAAIPASVRTLRARNAMLSELHGDQVNILQAHAGSARTTHLFTRSSGLADLK